MDSQNLNNQQDLIHPDNTNNNFNNPNHDSADKNDPPKGVQPEKKRPAWLLYGVPIVVLFAALGLGVYFFLKGDSPKKTAVNTESALTKINVRLEWVHNPEFAGMYVAKEKGFYKESGLDVNLKEYEDSADVNKEVSEGKADYGVSTPLEVVLARDSGEKNKAIAAIYQTSPYSIATQKPANIKTPADFKGKVLGATGNNNEARVTYAVLMANAGLQPTDATVKAVDFDAEKVLKESQAQTADIYRNDETYALDKAGIKYDQIFPEQFGFDIYGDVLIASEAKIKQNPTQAEAFVKATLKGWQYALDNQNETLTIMSKYANEIYKDVDYQKYVLSSTAPMIRPTGGQNLGDMQYVYWNRAYNGVKQAGMLKTTFDASALYTTQFVR